MPTESGTRLEREVLPGGAVMSTLRGGAPGPTLALLGGVHGDEDEGVLAVWRVLREVRGVALRGVVRAVAPANPAAWAARGRTSPYDDGDLARSFPGDPEAGPTAALADGIAHQVIAGSDLLIDLHSAGLRYSMPLFCGVNQEPVDGVALRAAVVFEAPMIWLHESWPPGRSLTAAMELGVPAVYVECGGGGGIRSAELDAYVTGVLSVMGDLGMVPTCRADRRPTRWVSGSGDLDSGVASPCAGLFSTTAVAGELMAEGSEVGRLFNYQGDLLEVVRAPRPGVLMFLRRHARVKLGDVLFVLAVPCDGP
ncbi:putative deacylase [Kribbella aluminosa]|uniref:Deacylase n=1 Tax=Kribbella aluminosa TaxID=416017 RepID=A0ABS4UDE4_9ACTN|nr:M14 family metallopeptidase [Kribbella aluminosa]MBP2349654.1 putative deacylase [Kribbella aluminosa]